MTAGDLSSVMVKLKGLNEVLTEKEISAVVDESYSDYSHEIDFETFLRVHCCCSCETLFIYGVTCLY